MANFIGVIMSCLISVSAIPLVIVITDHDILSQPINMMIIGFGFLASVVMVFYLVLPPKGIKKQLGKEGRGVLYYTCCVFMWASVADFTLQSRQLGIFGFASNNAYFDHGEPYLQTPFGIGVQYWNAVINFILYANIIYKIDNHIDPRFTAIYWAGGILTSQFCVLFGAYTGSYAAYLPPSVAMNVVFVVYPFWVFFHFINKPRAEKIPPTNDSKYRVLDVVLVVSLLIASFFMAIRGLGGFDSPFPLTQHYVTK
uniref:EXPERA domain-containing protein n=1 Tax=Ciona savignyi TaxID=51511 RepID=H2Z5B8_CIOSA